MDISCKNCVYYKPTLGMEQELTGHFETMLKPFGVCGHMDDEVREDEWCGAFVEKEKDSLDSGDRGRTTTPDSGN